MNHDPDQATPPSMKEALQHGCVSLKMLASLLLPNQILQEHNFTSRPWLATYFLVTAALVGSRFTDGPPSIAGSLFIGSVFGLATYVSCWTSLTRHWSRFLYSAAALTFMGLLFENWEGTAQFDWVMFLLPWIIALPVTATLEAAKRLWGTFALMDSDSQPQFTEGIQFSIRHLLILTTSAAVLFGVWNVFANSFNGYFSRRPPNQVWPFLTLMSATVATFTILSVWSLLGHWRLWRLGVAVTAGSAAIFSSTLYTMPQPAKFYWILFFYVCWAALISLLILLRIEGYRFIRKGSTTPND